jgi:hypothetical protein
MVEMSHTQRECVWALKALLDGAPGFLDRFDWGCQDGEHVGWAIIEAENKFQAQELVPQILRAKTRILELRQFTPDQVRSLREAQV